MKKLQQILANTHTQDPALLLTACSVQGVTIRDAQQNLFTMLKNPQDPLMKDSNEFPQIDATVKTSLLALATNYNEKLRQTHPQEKTVAAPHVTPGEKDAKGNNHRNISWVLGGLGVLLTRAYLRRKRKKTTIQKEKKNDPTK